MAHDNALSAQGGTAKKLYSLKAVRTPLPSQLAAERADEQQSVPNDPQIRAENEDDDGYDPYSDRIETAPLFEQDPWS